MEKKSKKKKLSNSPAKKQFTFEEVSVELNDQQKLFCMEYLRLKFNGYQAAMNAGYSKHSARAQASYLLTNPNIQLLISKLKKDLALQLNISALDIAREYARIGFSDIRKIFDEDGNLIQVNDLEDESAANVSSIEVFEEYQGRGEEREFIGRTKKVRLYNKVDALDKLARMIGVDGVTKVEATNTNLNSVPMTKEEIKDISKQLEDEY